jgi:hypothetical protein
MYVVKYVTPAVISLGCTLYIRVGEVASGSRRTVYATEKELAEYAACVILVRGWEDRYRQPLE